MDQYLKDKIEENEKYYLKVEELVLQTWAHIGSNREDFEHSPEFTFYYIMLLNNPFSLAKYLSVRQEQVNIRLFRSYLSYVFKEDIFEGNNVLYFGRRIFMVVLETAASLLPV